ncbi:hypothetical protein R5R35_002874 [Gryllus longicercus]|uniref:DNA polymerase delta subunit 3 n=1 Tax=Gryllus longicercus TaxID=2509291 RepID=A0AAN9VM86_9ORTH
MGESDNIEDVGYLQDIISYIFDEKKIVTYKWISNVLSIHVNRAKQLLFTFIKHISEERLKELQVTYLVGGILPNDRGCRLQVVSEDDLEKVKAQFKVITSEHIYSVSLKTCLVDLQNLCSVDGVKDSEVGRHGAVKCLKSISRTSQESASKRQGAYKCVEDDKKWPTAQAKTEKETSTGSNGKKSAKANGISAMFAAQNGKKKVEDTSPKKPDVKSAEKSSPEKKVPAPKNSSKGGKPPANRLAAMFSAQNTKPKTAKKDVQEEDKPKTNNENSEKDLKDTKNNSKLEEKHEKNTDSKNTQEKSSKTNTKSASKKSKQKKRKASDNQEKSKKRKRIVMMDDSDSSDDDIFGSDKDDEEEDKSLQLPPENEEEEEEIEKPTEVAPPKDSDPSEPDANVHHARKRHLVDRTFMDEEGYMVTKKVYEYVSCDESGSEGEKENEKALKSKNNKTESESKDNESESEPKKLKADRQTPKTVQGPQKSLKNSNQKKNSSPEKKKQATLMNFFKRN